MPQAFRHLPQSQTDPGAGLLHNSAICVTCQSHPPLVCPEGNTLLAGIVSLSGFRQNAHVAVAQLPAQSIRLHFDQWCQIGGIDRYLTFR